MKKFEPYVDGKKIGTINASWSTLRNKYVAGALSAVMTVMSLTGCSIKNNKNIVNKTPIEITVNNEMSELELNQAIEEKSYFVNQVLNELQMNYTKDGNTIALSFYNRLLEQYKEYASIEYNIDPSNENEYAEVITFSSLKTEKQKMLNILNSIINEIERETNWRYGKDFIMLNHGCASSIEEAIELKENFVNNVMSELYESYKTTGNTISLALYNDLLETYKHISSLKYNIDPENEREYNETIIFDSIDNVKAKILYHLDEMIIKIEDKTDWSYGIDFRETKTK